tara:strand:- start:683 stop:823 length:141 start_codon:yes stop_codon:yes gene_type:complete
MSCLNLYGFTGKCGNSSNSVKYNVNNYIKINNLIDKNGFDLKIPLK